MLDSHPPSRWNGGERSRCGHRHWRVALLASDDAQSSSIALGRGGFSRTPRFRARVLALHTTSARLKRRRSRRTRHGLPGDAKWSRPRCLPQTGAWIDGSALAGALGGRCKTRPRISLLEGWISRMPHAQSFSQITRPLSPFLCRMQTPSNYYVEYYISSHVGLIF